MEITFYITDSELVKMRLMGILGQRNAAHGAP